MRCNSDYRLRFCNIVSSAGMASAVSTVATVITACGFVTLFLLLVWLVQFLLLQQ